jgi:hypothetical protein
MARPNESVAGELADAPATLTRGAWLFSWPLVVGVFSYAWLYAFYGGRAILRDGDVYWHVAAGRWLLLHGSLPTNDPFSHTMSGRVWTAHEWLSELIVAAAHQWGGWTLVIAITALAFAAAIALLTRALLRTLEPIYALLFSALAIGMTAGHVLARPHVLAMPLMMIWTIELVRAADEGRVPKLWLLAVMAVWANMHGGFTIGIALAFAFGAEAVWRAWGTPNARRTARTWGRFTALALAASLLTPHGTQGILFTWQVMVESSYALSWIGEWLSPDFHNLQPLELWLLGGLALVMHQGLRLPPVRLLLVLGLLHLALKHVRNIELLGLLVPLLVAAPFAEQWKLRIKAGGNATTLDRFFSALARPAGPFAVAIASAILIALPLGSARQAELDLPDSAVPARAVQAAQAAGLNGRVLNNYDWGGYLIYKGIPTFVDGRADLYGDAFLKEYVEALGLRTSDGLEKLLARYGIDWTLLSPRSTAVALLDHMPEWRRLYADEIAVIHVKARPAKSADTAP